MTEADQIKQVVALMQEQRRLKHANRMLTESLELMTATVHGAKHGRWWQTNSWHDCDAHPCKSVRAILENLK